MISYFRNTDNGEFRMVGLSTDTKPTDDVPNGAAFIEMDTDKSYLFDAEGVTYYEVVSGGGGGGGGSSAPADWNASEGQPGYIKNRPFYEETSELTVTLPFTDAYPDEAHVSVTDGCVYGGLSGSTASAIIETMGDTPPNSIIIHFPGKDIKLIFAPSEADAAYVPEGWDGTSIPYVNLYIFGGAIELGVIPSMLSTYLPDYDYDPNDPDPFPNIEMGLGESTEVHKIDSKFLPDDIGGITVIPLTTSDGNNLYPPAEYTVEAMSQLAADIYTSGKAVMFTLPNGSGTWPALAKPLSGDNYNLVIPFISMSLRIAEYTYDFVNGYFYIQGAE